MECDLLQLDANVQRVWDTLLLDNTLALSHFWQKFSALPGAVVILDEHDEFYQPQYKVGYDLYTSFQHFAVSQLQFCNSNLTCYQAAQLVMFVGSKFQNNIPDGYRNSVVYLQPLSESATRKFVRSKDSVSTIQTLNSTNALLQPVVSLQWHQIPGHNAAERFESLFNVCGGVDRPIIELCAQLDQGLTFQSAKSLLCTAYYTRLVQTVSQLQKGARERFVDVLKVLQNSGSTPLGIRSDIAAAIHDCGLLYITSDNRIAPINGAATDAIKLLLFQDSTPILGAKDAKLVALN